MAKILVVEDDIAISRNVKDWLESEKHKVDTAFNGDSALDYLNAFEYDLLLLDRQLPGRSGVELCRYYRTKSNGPVLMLTGMSSVQDKISGLDAGADDYLTKPFDPGELLARVRALLRRGAPAVSEEHNTIRGISLDSGSRKVKKDGIELQLTKKEFDVLEFFFKHPNQVISPDALLKRVWESESDATQHAVYNCINRLRKNLDANNKEALIKTVHGVGYRLDT
jgi:DNA-binding response OmpR family regulator